MLGRWLSCRLLRSMCPKYATCLVTLRLARLVVVMASLLGLSVTLLLPWPKMSPPSSSLFARPPSC
eukprot:7996577-Prorocentrum_lima.AAC.1